MSAVRMGHSSWFYRQSLTSWLNGTRIPSHSGSCMSSMSTTWTCPLLQANRCSDQKAGNAAIGRQEKALSRLQFVQAKRLESPGGCAHHRGRTSMKNQLDKQSVSEHVMWRCPCYLVAAIVDTWLREIMNDLAFEQGFVPILKWLQAESKRIRNLIANSLPGRRLPMPMLITCVKCCRRWLLSLVQSIQCTATMKLREVGPSFAEAHTT